MTTEAEFDRAEALVDAERAAGIGSASRALTIKGTAECVACGAPIPSKRRLAFPAARRCIGCQTLFEAK